jgi:[ribosomal protein S18]-alanine N-acetyltransferase
VGSSAEEIRVSALARRPEGRSIPDVELTRMRRRHLRKVLSIEARVYPRPWSASLFLAELSQRGTRTYLVARCVGEVVGYAGIMFMGREAHVTNIAVDPEYHGLKIGTRLLLTLCTEAIAKGADTISLEVRVTNRVAQSMYEKFGFEVAGVRRGYYVETHEDALVMIVRDADSTDYRLLLERIRKDIDSSLEDDPRGE